MTTDDDRLECRSNAVDGAALALDPRQTGSAAAGDSELERLKDQVEARTRELDEAQAELRRLRSFVSHDLRQPLAALTIWAELLNAKQAAALDDQGRRYLRELTASVHRVASMLSVEVQRASTPAPELLRDELSKPAPARETDDA